jgi:hypothetical protein
MRKVQSLTNYGKMFSQIDRRTVETCMLLIAKLLRSAPENHRLSQQEIYDQEVDLNGLRQTLAFKAEAFRAPRHYGLESQE